MTILKHKIVKAKKVHECHYCHKSINPGDSYVVWRELIEHTFSGYKMHQNCESIFFSKMAALDDISDYYKEME